ncbi:MAG: hypothetical protein EA361_06280 [Bacteroidetes bacterium]|nr:MAG: hypothetical protein EA361_06280 [Bacteroidota bacterium]
MKYLITVLIVFCFTALHAQTEQNFILSTQIGYSYTYEDKADYSTFSWESMQLTDRKINDFNFSIAIGRRIHTNFYYGLGIAWNRRKTDINPNADKPLTGIAPGYSIFYNRTNIVIKSNVISPLVYLQYFMRLSERMHFTLDLVSQYDFVKNSDESFRHQYEPVFPGFPKNDPTLNPVIINSDKNESDQQYFNIGIHPGFRVNLYKNFGMNVAFGSVAYRIKTADSRLPDMDFKKSREFNVTFTPENWRVGFYLAF